MWREGESSSPASIPCEFVRTYEVLSCSAFRRASVTGRFRGMPEIPRTVLKICAGITRCDAILRNYEPFEETGNFDFARISDCRLVDPQFVLLTDYQ